MGHYKILTFSLALKRRLWNLILGLRVGTGCSRTHSTRVEGSGRHQVRPEERKGRRGVRRKVTLGIRGSRRLIEKKLSQNKTAGPISRHRARVK